MTVDLLRLDPVPARHLANALARAADDLRLDRIHVDRLLHDAGPTIGRLERHPISGLARASFQLDSLAHDLHRRLAIVEQTGRDLARIDELTADIARWGRHDPARAALIAERSELVAQLLGDDAELVAAVMMAIRLGADAGEAMAMVRDAAHAEARAQELVAALGLSLDAARRMVAEIDADLARLVDAGRTHRDAVVALAMVQNFDVSVEEIVARASDRGSSATDAAGAILAARALGLTLDELDALSGLEEHFAALDAARTRVVDGRVGLIDLEHIVAFPAEFTSGQVMAAQALLDQPMLRHRLDTAHENDDILGPASFGRRSPGDGVIGERDLQAFLHKAQLHHILGPYAERIDIADDPAGNVDGIVARADIERFLADNDDLPESVVAASHAMIEGGWFHESWWQAHKDELAMGAALLVGGAIIVVTAGSAGLVVVAGAGGLAAGGTTVAINLGTGDDPLDDVAGNSLSGLMVGAGVHGLTAGASSYAIAATPLERSAAVAGILAGSSEIVTYGGIDLLLPEEVEDDARELAAALSAPSAAADALAPDGVDLVDAVNLARMMASELLSGEDAG